MSKPHRDYLYHREHIRTVLVKAGYLMYSPWDAIKGSWDPRAQAINWFAIQRCDLFLNLTPPGIPAEETDVEEEYARSWGKQVSHAIPGIQEADLLAYLEEAIGPGVPYE